ncbi:MAG: NADH-quinone oxidoreductase subunit J [Thermoanaerobaculales bacterium]
MDFLVANFSAIFFYTVAVLTVVGGVGVIAARNPVHSALCLLWTFFMVAVLFVFRHAEFLAAVQVLVYAGGIMVLYLFVIMLVKVKDLRPEDVFLSGVAPLAVLGGVLLGVLITGGILAGSMAVGSGDPAALVSIGNEAIGNTEAVGWVLYTRYLVPFEVVSVVLLVAIVGAIVFGRRDAVLDIRKRGVES